MAADHELLMALTAHATASALDGWSSWRQPEANRLLRSSDGRFGWQGVGIKTAIFGGNALVSVLIVRKWPRYRRAITVANWISAGVYLGVVASNRMRQRR